MASSINASTSAGLVQTADTSGVLALQTANTTALTIDASQHVGIGTSSPTQNVSIGGSTGTYGQNFLYTGNGGPYTVAEYSITPSTGEIRLGGTNTTGTYFQTFYTQNTERMRIDSSGNVGIGTTSPADIVDVTRSSSSNSNGGLTLTNTSNSGYGSGVSWNLKLNSTAGNWGRINVEAASSTATFMRFFTTVGSSLTEQMRIDLNGNLLVGTTSASNKFVVSAASGGTAVAQIINTSSSGNVISFSSTLQSNGNNTNSAHFQGNTTSVGNWYLFGNGTSSYSSDERLKKNIETTRSGYLEDLCKLRVVKYNWKLDEEGKNKELGLIAQEVEQIFPNLVQDDLNPISKDDATIYKQLKQSVLPFMLLKAVQELNAKVDSQQALIANLTTRLSALEGAK
jgi:hypothetical protein